MIEPQASVVSFNELKYNKSGNHVTAIVNGDDDFD